LPTPTQEDKATQDSEEKPLFSCSECELEFTGSLESEQGKLLENLYQNDALTCPECGGSEVRWFD
jgi:DNA-directed RNA polymerase subunit RPC12/RpoP